VITQGNSLEPNKGQASLEMTLALIGTVLLLFGSLKIFVWLNERLITRQQRYEATRVLAGSAEPGKMWNEPSQKLDIFGR